MSLIACSVCNTSFIEAKSNIYFIKIDDKKVKQCSYNCNRKAVANKEANLK
jgi:hypothetical protein